MTAIKITHAIVLKRFFTMDGIRLDANVNDVADAIGIPRERCIAYDDRYHLGPEVEIVNVTIDIMRKIFPDELGHDKEDDVDHSSDDSFFD